MLVGSDSNTWWKAVGNEIVRPANEIDNRARATDNIEFSRKGEVPRGHTVAYEIFYVINSH